VPHQQLDQLHCTARPGSSLLLLWRRQWLLLLLGRNGGSY
jgi:hypothetical protein